MQQFKNAWMQLVADIRAASVREEGQGTVEYILVTGVVVLLIVTVFQTAIGPVASAAITKVTTAIGAV